MYDEIRARIIRLRGLYTTGLDYLSDWNKLVPSLQGTAQYINHIYDTLDDFPSGVDIYTDENFLHNLQLAEDGANFLGAIPQPPSASAPVFNTTGSALVYSYNGFINNVSVYHSDKPMVVDWARKTISVGQELDAVRNRSEKVQKRLTQLEPGLGQLHKDAVYATLAAEAKTQNPIEAAALINRVLERFRGELWGRCNVRRKPEYKCISENFAANSNYTKTMVSDGQGVYIDLNQQLVDVRKVLKPSTGRMLLNCFAD